MIRTRIPFAGILIAAAMLGSSFTAPAATTPAFTSPATAVPNPAIINTAVTFTAAASDGTTALVITWDFGDGSAKVTGNSVTHKYTVAGLYNISASAPNATSSGFTLLVTKGKTTKVGTIKYSESSKDAVKSFHSPDGAFTDVVSSGKVTLTADIPLGDVPLSSFSGDSVVQVSAGGFQLDTTLGAATSFKTKKGGPDAKYAITTTDPTGNKTLKAGTAEIIADSTGVHVKASFKTVNGFPSIIAADYEGATSGPISTNVEFDVVIGDLAFVGTLNVTGNVTTVTKTVGKGDNAQDFPLSTISVTGSGQ